MLDNAILQRVKRDYNTPATRLQVVDGASQSLLKAFELAVDRDPQCLEGTGGGVEPFFPLCLRDGAFNDVNQLQRALYRLFRAGLDDKRGNAFCPMIRSSSATGR